MIIEDPFKTLVGKMILEINAGPIADVFEYVMHKEPE